MAAPSSPDWSDLPSDHNLAKFAAELPAILKDAEYDEMYGVKLEGAGEGYTSEAYRLCGTIAKTAVAKLLHTRLL
jgi:hypothetical protein